jgi:hypothetical protein
VTRRSALVLLPALARPLPDGRAPDRAAFLDVLMKLAAALAASDAAEFFRHIDKSFPDRERLRGYIEAITGEAEITSSVEVIGVSDDAARADWYLELKSRAPAGPLERRRQVLTVRMNGERKVTTIDPVEFFAPMKL